MKRLNEQKVAVVDENILKENPEGYPDEIMEPVIIAKHIPEYRKVQFLNGRDPGYPLEFHYHSKNVRLKQYKLLHGHEYDLPLEIVEHLEQCSECQYGYRTGMDGHPEMFVKSRRYLYQCRQVPRKAA